MTNLNVQLIDDIPRHKDGSPRFARGWHVMGLSQEFEAGKAKTLEHFGTRLVGYRGEDDGQIHILDAFCPHMGADLSKGCVKGNSVVCPFHAWSWGADGVCDDIPYAKRIPPKAKIKSWSTMEENGLVFVWHDPEGNPPIESQRPSRMDDYYSDDWTDWTLNLVAIESHCSDLVDNMADMGHFGPVHFSKVQKFRNVQDAHTFTQFMEGGHEILTEGETPMTSVAHYEGPAYMTTTMTGEMDGQPMKVHLLVAHAPVNEKLFHIRLGVMMKKDSNLSEKQNKTMVDEYTKLTIDSFIQDVEIWNNKIIINNPILCDGDGPIYMVRKWYHQFYTDIADIPTGAVEYKEHVTVE